MQSSIPYGSYPSDQFTYLDTAKQRSYDSMTMTSSFAADNGILMLPLSDPDAVGCIFARLHNTIGTRQVDFEVTKKGGPPVVPAPMDAYVSGDVIMDHSLTFAKPIADNASGGTIWSVQGSYTYGQASVRNENSHFETGLGPTGESWIYGNMGQNVNRDGSTGSLNGTLAVQGFNGVYPDALYGIAGTTTDNFVPVVDFSQPDYQYLSPIFSNQFFVQQLVM